MKRHRIVCSVVVFASAIPWSAIASTFSMHVASFADGNIPSSEVDDQSYDLFHWQLAGQAASTHAHAGRDVCDPPFTESDARALFDQSDPTNAVQRARNVARRAYWGLPTELCPSRQPVRVGLLS